MNVREFFSNLSQRWGKEWIVDRLLSLAGKQEGDWIECKATMAPPDNWEKTLEELKARKNPEFVPKTSTKGKKNKQGDYVLHVLKAIIALTNSSTGGIILLGMAEGSASFEPAYIEGLCSNPDHRPTLYDPQSGSLDWNTDKWEQEIHVLFRKNSWKDSCGQDWTSSVPLENLVKIEYGVFHRSPILIFIVSPSTDKFVWLTSTGCPHQCPQHSNFVCGHKKEHFWVWKRRSASDCLVASPEEFIELKKELEAFGSYSVFESLLNKDLQFYKSYQYQKESLLEVFSKLRAHSLEAEKELLQEDILARLQNNAVSSKLTFRCRGNYQGYEEQKRNAIAASYCYYLQTQYELDHTHIFPVFLSSLQNNFSLLKKSTRDYFTSLLASKIHESVKSVKQLCKAGKLHFFVVCPDCFMDLEQENLWKKAILSLAENEVHVTCFSPQTFSCDDWVNWEKKELKLMGI